MYQKGIDLLLSGYGRAVDRGLRLPLLIAGQAHEESGAFIQRRVEALGLADSISLLGEVSEAEKWGLLASARCLAFLSRWDGPPRPIREAIAMGTPVIVTPGTNLGGLVMEAGAGMAVDFDPDAVAEGMVAASMEATVTRWREGVRDLNEALSWDRVARDYEEGYAQVLASRPR